MPPSPPTTTVTSTDLRSFMSELVEKSETKLIGRLTEMQTSINSLSSLKQDVSTISTHLDQFKKNERKKNILVYGILDNPSENWKHLEDIINELAIKLELPAKIDYDHCYRLGKYNKSASKPRPILIKLLRFRDKLS